MSTKVIKLANKLENKVKLAQSLGALPPDPQLEAKIKTALLQELGPEAGKITFSQLSAKDEVASFKAKVDSATHAALETILKEKDAQRLKEGKRAVNGLANLISLKLKELTGASLVSPAVVES